MQATLAWFVLWVFLFDSAGLYLGLLEINMNGENRMKKRKNDE